MDPVKDSALETLRRAMEIVERQAVNGFVIYLSFDEPDEQGNDNRVLVGGSLGLMKVAAKEIRQAVYEFVRKREGKS
jgi:hypothetical protein